MEGMSVSHSSVARVLKTEGIKGKKSVKRKSKAHQPRTRKPAAGIMWQTDASKHMRFGKGYGFATLHAYIDDATGTVVGALFTKNECAFDYAGALSQGILSYGLPLSIYSDRHTIFRSPKELTDDEILHGVPIPLLNFGKALYELGIKQIMAHTPQAKGRIERFWNIFHDRLTAEMRLLGITNITDANKMFTGGFLNDYNRRFAVIPQKTESACIPFDKRIDLRLVFSIRDIRKAGGGNTISYNEHIYTPAEPDKAALVPRSTLKVRETLDEEVYVIHNGKAVLMKKLLLPRKAADCGIKKKAGVVSQHKPALDHPWKSGFRIYTDSDVNNIIYE